MKLKLNGKSKFLSVAAAAVAMLGLAGLAKASPSVSLNIVYLGSTTGTETSGTDFDTDNNAFTTYTSAQLNSAAVQNTPGLINVYGIFLSYDGGVSNAADAFKAVSFNIVTTGAITGAASDGATNNPSVTSDQKYFGAGITDGNKSSTAVLANNLDGGTNGDLQDIFLSNNSATNAFSYKFGTSSVDSNFLTQTSGNLYSAGYKTGNPAWDTTNGGIFIGDFGVAFTNGALSAPATISITPLTGAYLSWYTDTAGDYASATTTTGPIVLTSNTVTITGSAPVPEPASLGVLALGGLALLARRRKTA